MHCFSRAMLPDCLPSPQMLGSDDSKGTEANSIAGLFSSRLPVLHPSLEQFKRYVPNGVAL
jgi:hypothetical protein